MPKFKLEHKGATGELQYAYKLDKPITFKVITKDERLKQRVETYFTTKRKFYIPESDVIDDYRVDEGIPTDNGTYFELALNELTSKTGVDISW